MKHVVECTKAIRLWDSMAFTLGVHIMQREDTVQSSLDGFKI